MVKNLEYIARSAMFYLKKSSDQDYPHFLQYAKRWYTEVVPHEGLRRLGVHYGKLDKLSRLGLPDDFVMYTRIGVLVGNRVWTLTIDPTLAMIPVPACLEGLTETEGANNEDTSGIELDYLFNSWWPQYKTFGASGGFNVGYYRPDLPNNVIYFDSTLLNRVVVLEYISNGSSVDGNTRVMEAYVNAGINYCAWMDIEYDMTIPVGERQRRQDQYDFSMADANFAANSPLIAEVLDAIYTATGDRFAH
ncbi:MAG: hypothetical protein E6Q97_04805 [Desulfurellales bacterium]|jgi:hypothetical protein|nr:MAG: hypothetical protein E6Q97_04805 [Desulfurellales bacterium]